MIKEWSLHRDISQDWFKININGNPMSLQELMDPEGGLIEEGFVRDIINTLKQKIEENSDFEFDTSYSNTNRERFIEKFASIRGG